ncbi:beta-ribofuranosylaminobenzene 5'-phosphate synthase family protein [Halovenus marina]|uniref:beta-ribofuranosylaminobenzene 5'-phosphate synthase family protein n=1 Tax=Halovenus marina TaxID=3396621 RepID=UPI003F54D4A2
MVVVETGARLHFGFQNLSLAHERLYGGVGVSLEHPRIVLEVTQAPTLSCSAAVLEPYAREALDHLGLDGARLNLSEGIDRHVGLGSGTQLALASLVGIARAYGRTVDPREAAPSLGRGGRSGVGVATFERGGFVVDAGHRTERFTTAPPAEGSWTVPKPIVTEHLPDEWRFVLVRPDTDSGLSGADEDESMRSIVERADPGIADEIATLLTRQLLPAVAEQRIGSFGAAVARLSRLNGAWYADEQGGVYRPPAGKLVEVMSESPVVTGAGQSSWGPTVYGVTSDSAIERAREDGERALDAAGVDGRVEVVRPRNEGAVVEEQ